jgi:large subunit ribosomal protein L10
VEEPRPEKVAVVEEVRERLSDASAAILTEYRGLRVQEMATLRRALTAAGGEYKVYKNTLVRRAAQEIGLAELEPYLEGPTAIAFVKGDVAAVAKVLRDFSRTTPNLVVKGGLVGRNLFDAKGAARLADLPSREVLLAQLAGAIAAPMQKLAALMKALPQNLAYGISALFDAKGGLPVEADEPSEPSAAPADDAAASADDTAAALPTDEEGETEAAAAPAEVATEAEVASPPSDDAVADAETAGAPEEPEAAATDPATDADPEAVS